MSNLSIERVAQFVLTTIVSCAITTNMSVSKVETVLSGGMTMRHVLREAPVSLWKSMAFR